MLARVLAVPFVFISFIFISAFALFAVVAIFLVTVRRLVVIPFLFFLLRPQLVVKIVLDFKLPEVLEIVVQCHRIWIDIGGEEVPLPFNPLCPVNYLNQLVVVEAFAAIPVIGDREVLQKVVLS